MFLSEVGAAAFGTLTDSQLKQVLGLAEVGFGRRRAAVLAGVHVQQVPVADFVIARRRGKFFRETQRDISIGRLPPHPGQWPPGETQPNGVIYTP